MGDGCNMEGISNEAASLAGHWGLGKLIALYDDNKISIDGDTDISFTEDVSARYEALGWHVQHVVEGNTDIDALRAAIAKAKEVTDKPSMIKVRIISSLHLTRFRCAVQKQLLPRNFLGSSMQRRVTIDLIAKSVIPGNACWLRSLAAAIVFYGKSS